MPESNLDSKALLLAEFSKAYQEATLPHAILADYCARHPQLAEEFRAYAKMIQGLDEAGTAPPTPELKELPGFRILRKLETGGMGEIYEAEQEPLGRRVAVKVIRHGRNTPEARERFLREQRILASLHQTHIVPIHAAGQVGDLQYFVMPFIKGATLHHVVQTGLELMSTTHQGKTPTLLELAEKVRREKDVTGRPTVREVPTSRPRVGQVSNLPSAKIHELTGEPTSRQVGNLPHPASTPLTLSDDYFRSVARCIADAAEALQHAHDAKPHGILHRDLKPSNLMIDTNGHCWIIDFGLAAFLNEDELRPDIPVRLPEEERTDKNVRPASRDGTTGGMKGTPGYMAPEQWTGQPLDARTDVRALGCILYELLTLHRPFTGKTILDIQEQTMNGEVMAWRRLVKTVPVDLAAICRKALQKRPEERYATTQEMAEELQRWLKGEPAKASRSSTVRKAWLWGRRNKGWAVAIAVTLASTVLMAAIAGAYQHQQTQEERRLGQIRTAIVDRLSTPHPGLFDDAWESIRQAARIRTDDDLRDQAAALLGLPDAIALPGIKAPADSLAFDTNGRLLLGGTLNGGVKLWDGGLTPPALLESPCNGPIAFDAMDTPLQAVVNNDDTIVLLNLRRNAPIREFKLPPRRGGKAEATSLTAALSADGSYVAALRLYADETGTIAVWESASGRLLRQFEQFAISVAITPDGKYLAAGGLDGRVTVWPLPAGEPVVLPALDATPIFCLAFQADYVRDSTPEPPQPSWLLAAGGRGGALTVWDVNKKVPRNRLRGSGWDVFSVCFRPDAAVLASAGRDHVRLWDVERGSLIMELVASTFTFGLAFSRDGKRLAAASSSDAAMRANASIDVWDLSSHRGVQTLRGLSGNVALSRFSPDGKLLAVLSHNWHIGLWDVASGQLRFVIQPPVGTLADNADLAFSPTNDVLAYASGEMAVAFDVRSGTTLKTWKLPHGFHDHLAFPARDRLLLYRVEDEGKPGEGRFVAAIRRLPQSGEPQTIRRFEQFQTGILMSALPGDGSYCVIDGLMAPSHQRVIAAFNVATGQPVWSFDSSRNPQSANALVTDPHGRTVAIQTKAEEDTLLINVASGQLVGQLNGPARCLSADAAFWVGRGDRELVLSLRGSPQPILRVGLDVQPNADSASMSASAPLLAYGNFDGTVTLCDLREVHRRLAALGLAW